MTEEESRHQLLLRHLDGQLGPNEEAQVAALLRFDPEARSFLREVAEQAVAVADLERAKQRRSEEMEARLIFQGDSHEVASQMEGAGASFKRWHWALATVAAIALLAAIVFSTFTTTETQIARVSEESGPNKHYSSDGQVEHGIKKGTRLRTGDTLETLSNDAWLELELSDGSRMTIAGRSILRILEGERGGSIYRLSEGNLWANVNRQPNGKPLAIQTKVANMEVLGTQFDIEARSSSSILRVNEGVVRAKRLVDGHMAEVPADHQVIVSLNRTEDLSVLRQPAPVNQWNCSLLNGPEAVFGKWLPPTGKVRVRLGALPYLINRPNKGPLTLFAANFSVQSSGSPPVLLDANSRIRVQGQTRSLSPVYFGITAKKFKGVFSGKYTVEVSAETLGPIDAAWEVDLLLKDFRPVDRLLSRSPLEMELTDIFVVSLDENASLEIHKVELLPRESTP